MSSKPSRALHDDLRELDERLAVQTAELDQVRKSVADQGEELQRLAKRRSKRVAALSRHRRNLILSSCLLGGIVAILILRSLGGFVLIYAAACLFTSGAYLLRVLYRRRRTTPVDVERRGAIATEELTARLAVDTIADRNRYAGTLAAYRPSSSLDSRGDVANKQLLAAETLTAQPAAVYTADRHRYVRRLAAYRSFSSHDNRGDVARKQLILAAAHGNGGELASFAECQTICQARWRLEFGIDEISLAIQRLVADKQLVRDATCFKLSQSSSTEIANRIRTSSEIEAVAFAGWEASLKATMPWLDAVETAQLREDLISWIHQLIVEHDVEAALVLYPDHGSFRSRLEEIRATEFGSLPTRDQRLMLKRPQALRTFLDDMTPIQREYFSDLVEVAYLVSALSMEPAALDAIHELPGGQRLYLDTNVVFSLMKLDGPMAYANTRRVLEMSRQLGYQVCVTPWTVAELEASVRGGRRRLSRMIPRQRRASETQEYADDLHDRVESALTMEQVEVSDDGCRAVDANHNAIRQQAEMLDGIGYSRVRPAFEADAKHRLLIKQLRGGSRRRFSNAGYLLLTRNKTVTRYAEASRTDPHDLPFAISFDGWARTMRALSPRTDNYDMTIKHLLDTPSLRRAGVVNQVDVIDAIRRIDAYNLHPELFSMAALLDTAFDTIREDSEMAEVEQARLCAEK